MIKLYRHDRLRRLLLALTKNARPRCRPRGVLLLLAVVMKMTRRLRRRRRLRHLDALLPETTDAPRRQQRHDGVETACRDGGPDRLLVPVGPHRDAVLPVDPPQLVVGGARGDVEHVERGHALLAGAVVLGAGEFLRHPRRLLLPGRAGAGAEEEDEVALEPAPLGLAPV
uniref:Uncharacterized protein n=1 Tax=Triticum urartu TaxID=4572 RepID=A0A8R7Q431_TRIUA